MAIAETGTRERANAEAAAGTALEDAYKTGEKMW
jgi:hypothetical protein